MFVMEIIETTWAKPTNLPVFIQTRSKMEPNPYDRVPGTEVDLQSRILTALNPKNIAGL